MILVNQGPNHLMYDNSVSSLSYNVVNPFGEQAVAKNVEKVELKRLDGGNMEKKIDPKATASGSTVKIDFGQQVVEMDWTSYQLGIQVQSSSTKSFLRRNFVLRTKIFEELKIRFSQTQSWSVPEKFQYEGPFPAQLRPVNSDAFNIIHFAVDTAFHGDSEKHDLPKSVYATLQKDDQVPFNVHLDFIEDGKLYYVASNLKFLIPNKINGDYKLQVHCEDPRSINKVVVDLGTLQINFNEGTNEALNDGMREDFKMYDKIVNYFPPEEPEKGAFIPLVFSGALGFMLFVYFTQLYTNSANMSNLSFWGLLFIVNYLAILGVIVAFWFKINLVNTLWILIALAPVTLFMMNKGLTPDNCHISGFSKKVKNN